VIAALTETGSVPCEEYQRAAGLLTFMLGPAVILLAVPLYRQTPLIRQSGPLVWIALAVGVPTGLVTGAGLAWLLGGQHQTLLSLMPKSVTTGIALGLSRSLGGTPALTAVFVIITGITGGVFGPGAVRLLGITDERVTGLAMGIGAHGIGTARALQIGEVAGAFSSLGMSLNGILTAMLLPLLLGLLHR